MSIVKETVYMGKETQGEILKRLRVKAGLTQRQLANELECTDQTISNWESDVRVPRLTSEEFLVLTKTLQCTLEELAGVDDGDER